VPDFLVEKSIGPASIKPPKNPRINKQTNKQTTKQTRAYSEKIVKCPQRVMNYG
jgi:hypothetical protein